MSDLFEKRTAIFSEDRNYRHMLRIVWRPQLPLIGFVGLNPSSADEFADDPTIRRCKAFAKQWGYGSLVMLNLFDLRTHSPKLMMQAADPIGPKPDLGGQLRLLDPQVVVCCWGCDGMHLARAARATAQILRYFGGSRLRCFGYNADGSPKHPLYLKGDTKLVAFPKEEN